MERDRVGELEAGRLHDVVLRRVLLDRVEDRVADVAGLDGVRSAGVIISAISFVTVLLPLVPVTAISGVLGAPRREFDIPDQRDRTRRGAGRAQRVSQRKAGARDDLVDLADDGLEEVRRRTEPVDAELGGDRGGGSLVVVVTHDVGSVADAPSATPTAPVRPAPATR